MGIQQWWTKKKFLFIKKMTCSNCGGIVEWKGRLSNLTHTECKECGSINSQEEVNESMKNNVYSKEN